MEKKSSSNNSFSPFKGHRPRYRGIGFSTLQMIESDFSKRRKLKHPSYRWSLPPPENLFSSCIWMNKHMITEKNELNSVKNRLGDYNMKEWHQHTRKSNHAGEVVNIVRKNIFPELLTQAWCKFYEIISCYDLVPQNAVEGEIFHSLHLCEAPGAFITSLNHFLKLNLPNIKWQWKASTLNPYYEGNKLSFMINDDRFILHTLDYWEFGLDQTGDMFKEENIDELISMSKLMAPIHLVTADGSIDCQNDPGEQENIVSPLHYCETLVALSVLSEGGSFLIKMFTMFECPSICLLYFLSCVFETVEFFKPATSKEGNSEVYVICLNFHGPSSVKNYLGLLRLNFLKCNERAMFTEEQIPLDFICKISECSDFFKTLQITVLERNIKTFDERFSDDSEPQLFKLKKRLAYNFLERYYLKPLSLPDDCIVGNDIIKQVLTLNLESRNEERAFSEKKSQDPIKIENILLGLKSQLIAIDSVWPKSSPWICFDSDQLLKVSELKINFKFGKPVLRVYSSKFCLGSLLNIWNKLNEFNNVSLQANIDSSEICEKLSESLPMRNIDSDYKICDMRQVEYYENVYNFEKECLSKLLNLYKTMNDSENLLLLGLPLLTRVSVGIVYCISQLFNKVYFLNPENFGYSLVFFGKQRNQILIAILENLLQRIAKETYLALHSIVPVTYLVKDPDWYKCIFCINQCYIKSISFKAVENLLSNPPEQEEIQNSTS